MLKSILKGAGTDTIKYFPVRLVPALTSFLTVPIFTRLVTREDYGDFYLIGSAVSLTAALVTSWLNASIVRFYWAEERQGRLDNYVATVIWSAVLSLLVGAAGLAVVLLALSDRVSPGVQRLIPVAIAGLIINQFINVSQQLMRAANRSKEFAMLAVSSNVLATAFSIFFVVVTHLGAYGILAGVVVGNLLLLPVTLKLSRSEGSLSPRKFERDIARQFASYGVPMIPAAVSSWVLILSDRYVIGLTQSAEQVGLYGTAYNLGDKLMNLITLPLLTAIGPVMVRTFEKHGQDLAEKVQSQLTRYFAMATVPLVCGLAVVAKPFMEVFTGPAYREAYPILPVVSAGVMLYGVSQIAGNGLAMHKKTVIMMQNTMIAAIFQVSMNLWLLPKFGYMVAAWNTLASYLLLLVLAWVRSRPYMPWHLPWGHLARITAAAVVMAAVVWVAFYSIESTILTLAAEVLLGIVLYAVALLVLRELDAEEREFFGGILKKMLVKLRLVRR